MSLSRSCQLKNDYDYYSKISTLPISQCVKEVPSKPLPIRKLSSYKIQQFYDMNSPINGLPAPGETINQPKEKRGSSMARRQAVASIDTREIMVFVYMITAID